MSKYTIYYNKSRNMYRHMATSWKKWSETTEISENDKKGISVFFRAAAKRFGLIKEFKDMGVI